MSAKADIRAHPVMIAQEMKRFVFLLIIPLLRGFVAALPGGTHVLFEGGWLLTWARGAWIDISALAAIAVICVLRWRACRIGRDPSGFYMERGLILRRFIHIPEGRAVTVSAVHPPLLRLFGAAMLRVDTQAGSCRGFDMRVPVSARYAAVIVRPPENAARPNRRYRPRNLYVAGISALLSNSFAGIVYVVSAVNQIGSLLGSALPDSINSGLALLGRLYSFGLEPIAATLGYIILTGWLTGFAASFIRHKNLSSARDSGHLYVSGGLVTRRYYRIAADKISYADIRRTALGGLLGVMPVLIAAVGFGKSRDDVRAVMPLATRGRVDADIGSLLPGFEPAPREIGPERRARARFLLFPLALGAASLLCGGIFWRAGLLSPVLALELAALPLIPSLWLLGIRIAELRSGGIGKSAGRYTLRYSKGYMLHTVTLRRELIASVEIKQSFFQRRSSTCDVYVRGFSECGKAHRVKGLDLKRAGDFFKG